MRSLTRTTQFALALIFVAVGMAASTTGCTKKAPAPGSENTLHLYTGEKIKGLDPAFADDLYSAGQVAYSYEGLLQYHYLKRPYTLMPSLAAAMPEMSADGLTYTFKIKKGVLFQDDECFKQTGGKGRELVAQDFVYSFKRLADPKLSSSGWWIFDGKIVGLNEWRDKVSKLPEVDYSLEVEGLKAVDNYTLQIKLTQRSSQFLYTVAMSFASVVAKEAVDHYGKTFMNHPVGTGPFRLEEYNPASKLVWVKNPTYRQETYPSEGEPSDQAAGLLADAGKPLPLSDKVVVQVFVESQPQWLNFMSGKIDYSGIPKDNYQQAISPSKELNEEFKKKAIALLKVPGLDVTHESFNMMDPVVGKNKKLRQALSLALNSEPLIELFYNGRAIPAQGPIPPGLAGYDSEFKNPYREFNLAKAKELMKEAGFPDGKGLAPIEYATVASSTSRQMTEYLEKSFDQLGVKLKVNSYSWPEFQAAVKNHKGQMWGFAWGADYPDAENFLQLFYSKNAAPGPNDSNYSSPEFDKLYEKALLLSDSPERTAIYKEMAKLVVEDCPWIFGVHRLGFYLVHPWLKNFKPHEFANGIARYLRVDAAVKKQQQQ